MAPSRDLPSRDLLMCPQYSADVYRFQRLLESDPKSRPLPYIETVQKKYITARVRAHLVESLFGMAQRLYLLPETLHLAVSLLDRFLSAKALQARIDDLELIGITAMVLAAKSEEMRARRLAEFCGTGYTKKELIDMEHIVLKALDFQVHGHPTAITFLEFFTRSADEEEVEEEEEVRRLLSVSMRFVNRSLQDYGCCVRFLPSVVAASALFLARLVLMRGAASPRRPWTTALYTVTGYHPSSDLRDCICLLHRLLLFMAEGYDYVKEIKARAERDSKYGPDWTSNIWKIPNTYFLLWKPRN